MLTTVEPARLADCMPDLVQQIGRTEREAHTSAVRARAFRWPHRRCALYRQYDDQGVLLYVGISTDLATRRRAHVKASVWVQFASVESSIWFDSVEVAMAAEQDAIVNERPIFNIVHADAGRDARVAWYLAHRGAHIPPVTKTRHKRAKPQEASQ